MPEPDPAEAAAAPTPAAPAAAAPFRPLPPPPPPWLRVAAFVRARWGSGSARLAAAATLIAAGAVLFAVLVLLSRPGVSSLGHASGHAGVSIAMPAEPLGAPAAPAPLILVHVAGDVVRPGVYSLAQGARVNDAVAAAGGGRPDADPDQLDLAAKLSDGDRIYVPRRGEPLPPGPAVGATSGSPAATPVLDLNSATAEQLDVLPGVGPSLAAAIVEYRRQHGRFRSVQELLDVPGIGDAKLAVLRPKVKVA